jgi:hypothetical protein
MNINICARIMAELDCECGRRYLIPADDFLEGEILPCECGRFGLITSRHLETAERLQRAALAELNLAWQVSGVETPAACRRSSLPPARPTGPAADRASSANTAD